MRGALSRPEEQRGLWVHRVTPADVSDFITPRWRSKGSMQTPSSYLRDLFHLSSKGHWHTGGLNTCLSTKRPSVLLINSSWKKAPNQPPKLKVECFDPFRGLWLSMVHIYWQTTIRSLRSIWCAMEKAEQLVFHQPFKSWCLNKNKTIKRIHCFPTSVQH